MSGGTSSRRSALASLLTERSLQAGSFTLSSGRTSSYYIDARRTTMSPAGLELIGELGLESIRAAGWAGQFVGGLTLGADPVAFAIALASRRAPPELGAFSVRKEAKEHGAGRQIEGCFEPGGRVVVVEDVVTTGGSALRAIEALVRARGDILGVVAVVDREEGGRAAIEALGYELRTLVSLADLGISGSTADNERRGS